MQEKKFDCEMNHVNDMAMAIPAANDKRNMEIIKAL